MTMTLIPESAPFSEEQRAWLNGFLSGWLSMQGSSADAGTALLENEPSPAAADDDLDDAPWHDASLPIVERMELAQDQPLPAKLMAAMAQLDCGSCGYLCKTYSAAIANGAESNLTLCSPGGKETKQMLKKLMQDAGEPTTGQASAPAASAPSNGTPRYTRQNPFPARLLEAQRLNKEGSTKDTRHVVLDLTDSGLSYQVGDALGVFPVNCDELVHRILKTLACDPVTKVRSPLGNTKALREALAEDCCLKDPSDELLEMLADRVSDTSARATLRNLLDQGVPDGFDVLDALEMATGVTLAATELIETLSPLNPRLYSIASSMRQVGSQVHLTVGKVTYTRAGRRRKGVASTMLAERIEPGERLRVFVQPNHGGFTVPADPNQPMIMVGPGTGIAPFMAFLQERAASQAPGKNWLFFGDQHQASDYLYQPQLTQWQQTGLLARLETAFSRDGDQKVYVQDRMRACAAELWEWLERGASFYVCGDAKRMATDVDRALQDIVAEQGQMSSDHAQAYVKQLAATRRYVRDVY